MDGRTISVRKKAKTPGEYQNYVSPSKPLLCTDEATAIRKSLLYPLTPDTPDQSAAPVSSGTYVTRTKHRTIEHRTTKNMANIHNISSGEDSNSSTGSAMFTIKDRGRKMARSRTRSKRRQQKTPKSFRHRSRARSPWQAFNFEILVQVCKDKPKHIQTLFDGSKTFKSQTGHTVCAAAYVILVGYSPDKHDKPELSLLCEKCIVFSGLSSSSNSAELYALEVASFDTCKLMSPDFCALDIFNLDCLLLPLQGNVYKKGAFTFGTAHASFSGTNPWSMDHSDFPPIPPELLVAPPGSHERIMSKVFLLLKLIRSSTNPFLFLQCYLNFFFTRIRCRISIMQSL